MQDAWGKAVLSEFQLSNIRTLVFCLWHSIDYSPARTVVEQESCRSMPRRRTMTACRTCTWRSTTPPSCSTTPPSWPTAACGCTWTRMAATWRLHTERGRAILPP